MNIKKLMIVMIAILFVSAPFAIASGRGPVTNNYTTENTYVLDDCFVGGANVAMDNIHPDKSAKKNQIGVGIGHSCNEFGGAIGYARREGDILWSGSAAYDDINKEQVGGAMNWSF